MCSLACGSLSFRLLSWCKAGVPVCRGMCCLTRVGEERERESGEAVRGDPTFVRQKCPTDAPVHIGMLAWDPPLPGHPFEQ